MKGRGDRQLPEEVVMKTSWAVPLLLTVAAPACDYRAPLGNTLEVAAVAPANGTGLGPAGTTHPAFRWRAGAGVTLFQLQIDDSCTAPATCTFPSPEIDERALTASSYLPAAELPYQTTAPVGTRYYWRVRACAADDVCGAWSP